jgi:hypothetical protein
MYYTMVQSITKIEEGYHSDRGQDGEGVPGNIEAMDS